MFKITYYGILKTCLAIVALNFVIFMFYGTVSKYKPKTVEKHTKFILYWTSMWGHEDFLIGLGHEPFQTCRFNNCFATSDRSVIPIEEYEAIVFHTNELTFDRNSVPTRRNPKQRYIFADSEAPTHLSRNLKHFENFYNWTMTYRCDSDIVRRYGRLAKQDNSYYKIPNLDFVKQKTKLIAWFVSNCKTASKRERIVKELQKYVQVDVYGSCGNLTCRKASEKMSSRKCYDMVQKEYMFYLSFENAYCKDYCTEKVYFMLSKQIIPVVYGGADYQSLLPPQSVINAADFDNIQELADYLIYVSLNPEEYLKYMEWKKHYLILSTHTDVACKLCEKLNDLMEPVKIYENISEWWWGKNRSICRTERALPKIYQNIINGL